MLLQLSHPPHSPMPCAPSALSIFYLPFMLLILCTFPPLSPPTPLLITLHVVSVSVVLFLLQLLSLDCYWQVNGKDLPRTVSCKDWLVTTDHHLLPLVEDQQCRGRMMVPQCKLQLSTAFPGSRVSLWDNFKCSNIHIVRVLEREGKKQGIGNLFEE